MTSLDMDSLLSESHNNTIKRLIRITFNKLIQVIRLFLKSSYHRVIAVKDSVFKMDESTELLYPRGFDRLTLQYIKCQQSCVIVCLTIKKIFFKNSTNDLVSEFCFDLGDIVQAQQYRSPVDILVYRILYCISQTMAVFTFVHNITAANYTQLTSSSINKYQQAVTKNLRIQFILVKQTGVAKVFFFLWIS